LEPVGADDGAPSVSVQLTAPEVTVGALHDAVNPDGSPETIMGDAPGAPAATRIPLTAWAVTNSVVFWFGMIVSAGCASSICTPVDGSTSTVYAQVVLRPSPDAVTLKVDQFTVAVGLAESWRVEAPFPDVIVTGLLLQDALTPLGNPVIERLMPP
jgi:hypothetical protein